MLRADVQVSGASRGCHLDGSLRGAVVCSSGHAELQIHSVQRHNSGSSDSYMTTSPQVIVGAEPNKESKEVCTL